MEEVDHHAHKSKTTVTAQPKCLQVDVIMSRSSTHRTRTTYVFVFSKVVCVFISVSCPESSRAKKENKKIKQTLAFRNKF